jgi:guanine deaminase
MTLVAHRGEILHFTDTLSGAGSIPAHQHFEDGILLLENGRVAHLGHAETVLKTLSPDAQINHHLNALITPGFIDTHVHYPQMTAIASYGTQLLDWLETYTFPAELKFSDPLYAAHAASFFLDQLIINGTTTALVFGTVHKVSVDAFFEAAEQRKLRMICGKVMMDRNAPTGLLDTPETSYQESKQLIRTWHGKHRLGYAVTPRFAPTSSSDQLSRAGQLLREHPGVHLHTHLSENVNECQWVDELFPERNGYLDVYDHHGLLGERSVFAHGIYLDTKECRRLHQTQSAIAHCPSSNFFIGSGLFKLKQNLDCGIKIGLGSDVGGGDDLSMLRVINQAYKMQQLQGYSLDPLVALYLATLGGAIALDLDSNIGNFKKGKEADFVVLDYCATPVLKNKVDASRDFKERLFALLMLGDDRAVRHCYVMGEDAKASLVS